MFRLLRLVTALVHAMFRKKITLEDEAVTTFRVWPTDVDASIMNHAPIMTAMEAGRVDYMVRTGFFTTAIKQQWYFPIASMSVQFVRPLKLFQKAEVKTKVLFIDDKWIFTQHSIESKGKCHVDAIVKSVVKKGRDRVAYSEIVDRLSIGKIPTNRPEIISHIESEKAIFEAHFSRNAG